MSADEQATHPEFPTWPLMSRPLPQSSPPGRSLIASLRQSARQDPNCPGSAKAWAVMLAGRPVCCVPATALGTAVQLSARVLWIFAYICLYRRRGALFSPVSLLTRQCTEPARLLCFLSAQQWAPAAPLDLMYMPLAFAALTLLYFNAPNAAAAGQLAKPSAFFAFAPRLCLAIVCLHAAAPWVANLFWALLTVAVAV